MCVCASSGIRGYNSAWPAPALAGRFIFYVLYQHTHTPALLSPAACAKESRESVCVCILLFTLVFFMEGAGRLWRPVSARYRPTLQIYKTCSSLVFFPTSPFPITPRFIFIHISWILIVRFKFNSNKSQTRRSSAHRAHTRTLRRLPWLIRRRIYFSLNWETSKLNYAKIILWC